MQLNFRPFLPQWKLYFFFLFSEFYFAILKFWDLMKWRNPKSRRNNVNSPLSKIAADSQQANRYLGDIAATDNQKQQKERQKNYLPRSLTDALLSSLQVSTVTAVHHRWVSWFGSAKSLLVTHDSHCTRPRPGIPWLYQMRAMWMGSLARGH